MSTTKFGRAQKTFGDNRPEFPCVCEFGQNRRQKIFHCGSSCLCRGDRHSKNVYLANSQHEQQLQIVQIINIFLQIPIIGSYLPTKIF